MFSLRIHLGVSLAYNLPWGLGRDMKGLYLILILTMAATVGRAQPMRTLDPDFFPNESYYYGPGLQTLDPDFFRSKSGQLNYAEEGQFGCLSVWAATAQGASAKLGRTVQNYCGEGRPMIQWIPRPVVYPYSYGSYLYPGISSNNYTNEPQGHYQVCCVKKSRGRRRRRPGTRP